MAEKIIMVALTPTMKEGHIVNWLKQEGDPIAFGDVLCEVETDKAVMDYESDVDGVLLKILVDEGSSVPIETPIAVCGKKGESIDDLLKEIAPISDSESKNTQSTHPDDTQNKQHQTQEHPTDANEEKRIKASPLAKKMSQEHQIPLHKIQGSGPGGRIIRRDIQAYINQGMTHKVARSDDPLKSMHDITKQETMLPIRQDKKIQVTEKRKRIAQRLTQSKFSAPHYYLKISVCMDTIIESRNRLNQKRESDKRVSMNAFLIKLIGHALKAHPKINASWQEDHIVLFSNQDIALAVAQSDGGLITPVVRQVAHKGIVQIDEELRQLVYKARHNLLSLEEYTNASFSVSNLGSFGLDEFTAIINPPAASILAIGKIQKQAIVGDTDEIKIASMMTMTLSCDHRVIDGADGARFLSYLKEIMETPILTLY